MKEYEERELDSGEEETGGIVDEELAHAIVAREGGDGSP